MARHHGWVLTCSLNCCHLEKFCTCAIEIVNCSTTEHGLNRLLLLLTCAQTSVANMSASMKQVRSAHCSNFSRAYLYFFHLHLEHCSNTCTSNSNSKHLQAETAPDSVAASTELLDF